MMQSIGIESAQLRRRSCDARAFRIYACTGVRQTVHSKSFSNLMPVWGGDTATSDHAMVWSRSLGNLRQSPLTPCYDSHHPQPWVLPPPYLFYLSIWQKRTIGWLCPFSSRCKEVQGQLRSDRGRTLGTMCTCEEIERGTHAYRASKLGPAEQWWTQDGKLGTTIQDPPPESGRRTHLLYFTYSYCILSRV